MITSLSLSPVRKGGVLLLMTGRASDLSEGRRQISEAVIGGAALRSFQHMMEAQGVTNETARRLCSAHVDYFTVLRKSEHQVELKTSDDGNRTTLRRSHFKNAGLLLVLKKRNGPCSFLLSCLCETY